MLAPRQHRFLILADGQFGPLTSKTANSCIRYFPERIVAVFDRVTAGRTVQDVLGFGGPIPVVGDFARGLALGASAVLIGIAPMGGQLPPLVRRGVRARFVATGQTGIFIEGWGIAVDAVVADFVAGAAEQLVLQGAVDADVVLVEGQGSLIHPGYSGVTLGLLHGTCPDALILCHQATRDYIGDYHGREPWVRIPPLAELVEIYERAAAPVRTTKVIGICLNTFDMTEAAARAAVAHAAADTGLPATDPVRFGAGPLADAITREAVALG